MKIFKRNEKGEPINLLAVVGLTLTVLGLIGLIILMGKSWMTAFVGVVYLYFFDVILDLICNLLCPLPKKSLHNNLPMNNSSLINHVGICLTSLRPSGFVEIEGNKHNAQTEGDFLEGGTEIVVVSHNGTKLVVRQKINPTLNKNC
ncbi:MAG: NfeD family protein [Sedimentisphaerales bacterium]|nr:NfeD family protein [Sedimentisphaerales bacterium]